MLDLGERPPRDSGTLRNRISGVFSSKPGKLKVLAKACQKARDSGKQGWDRLAHNKTYYTHLSLIMNTFIPII